MNDLTRYLSFLAGCSPPGGELRLYVGRDGVTCDLSHVCTIECRFDDDPDLVRLACERLGWTFVEGQKTFQWFGKWMDDYSAEDAAYKLGIDPKDYGKCDHAIKVPGASYEIGLVKQKDGTLLPVWDFFSSGGLSGIRADNGVGGFQQAYAVEKAKRELKKNRKVRNVKEVKGKDGKIELIATT